MARVTYDIPRGVVGADVARLQTVLNETRNAGLEVDGVYGGMTATAIRRMQTELGLEVSGDCKGPTLTRVRDLGFEPVFFDVTEANSGSGFPRRPSPATLPQPTAAITAGLFGTFQFEADPKPDNPENIRILGGWEAANIVSVTIPQLVGIPIPLGAARARLSNGKVRCHSKARDAIRALFQAWDDAGLTDRILTWDGGFNARLKRGKREAIQANLSNHSFGATIDINASLNPMGHTPRLMGSRGCVRELAVIAIEHGFYWGGHFGSNPDGMHFEVARL
jgi:hypothetical protein